MHKRTWAPGSSGEIGRSWTRGLQGPRERVLMREPICNAAVMLRPAYRAIQCCFHRGHMAISSATSRHADNQPYWSCRIGLRSRDSRNGRKSGNSGRETQKTTARALHDTPPSRSKAISILRSLKEAAVFGQTRVLARPNARANILRRPPASCKPHPREHGVQPASELASRH
jgi:hypothetical protein